MFTGRIGVREYWVGIVCLMLAMMAVTGIVMVAYFMLMPVIFKATGSNLASLVYLSTGGMILAVLPALISLPYSIGLQMRRLHDMGYSGWLLLGFWIVGFIPAIFQPAVVEVNGEAIIRPIGLFITIGLMLAFIVFISLPGTKGSNKYGEFIKYGKVDRMITGKKNGPVSESSGTASGIAWLVGAVALVILIIIVYAGSKM